MNSSIYSDATLDHFLINFNRRIRYTVNSAAYVTATIKTRIRRCGAYWFAYGQAGKRDICSPFINSLYLKCRANASRCIRQRAQVQPTASTIRFVFRLDTQKNRAYSFLSYILQEIMTIRSSVKPHAVWCAHAKPTLKSTPLSRTIARVFDY